MRKIIAFVVLVGAVAATAIAGSRVPEIDAAAGPAALAAIGGAMLIIRGRRKS